MYTSQYGSREVEMEELDILVYLLQDVDINKDLDKQGRKVDHPKKFMNWAQISLLNYSLRF